MEKIKLINCCESISDGDHLPPPKTESGIPFVTISNIINNNFDFSNTMFVSEEYYEKLDSKRKPQKDDILYSVVGSFGIPVLIKQDKKFIFQRHIAILRPNKEIIYPKYLYYTMLSKDFYAKADTVAIGAAQRTVSLNSLRNLTIDLPPLPTQTKIANILSAYDDLIENNQKQIRLLEEAAQRLYKECFVDFRFPGYETTEFVDGLPKGWKKCCIIDICIRANAGGTPSRSKLSYWDKPTIKWYKTGELQDCWLIDSDELINENGLSNSSAKLFPPNTILMAIYASPTLGRLGILSSEAACNQAALCLIANENIVSYQWLYLKLFELREEFNAVAKGAGQQNISAEVVKKKEITLPTPEIIRSFTNLVKPMFDKRLSLQIQSKYLSEARDRLLPKLMNGEIEISPFLKGNGCDSNLGDFREV